MQTRLILDTDIGTDVDDILALGLILASPELKLEGVTCVYGDVRLRARMVLKMLNLRGVSGVPVLAGAARPLLGQKPVYWGGHEGKGLLEPEDDALQPAPEHAPDFIVRMVMDNPGQIHLVGIGPLTNIAQAFLLEPLLAQNLAHLTLMGGVVRNLDRLDLPYCEHNIRSDPEAAQIVFNAGAPLTIVPLDVTTLVRIWPAGVERIKQAGTPYHRALAGQVELYPPYKERGFTFLHDPLAVSTLIQPDLVKLRDLHVDVETGGSFTSGATLVRAPGVDAPVTAQVALEVDTPRFEEFLVARLAN
ncbi:MAG: nucleoside hydrolase [Anaerolineaceae bacterium]